MQRLALLQERLDPAVVRKKGRTVGDSVKDPYSPAGIANGLLAEPDVRTDSLKMQHWYQLSVNISLGVKTIWS